MDQKRELIGDSLKRYRKSLGLSIPQVSAIMQQTYHIKVADKTIYGWESNQCRPPAHKMIALCEIYQINDIGGTFSQKADAKNFVITPLERRVVQGFRKYTEMQPAVRMLLRTDELPDDELPDAGQL